MFNATVLARVFVIAGGDVRIGGVVAVVIFVVFNVSWWDFFFNYFLLGR